MHKQLRLNMISGPLATVISISLTIVTYPVYLRILGYEKLGVWLLLTTFITFAQLLNAGVGPVLTKLVAIDMASHNIAGIKANIANSLALTLLFGLPVVLLSFFCRGWIVAMLGIAGDNRLIALEIMPYVGILTIYTFALQIFSAVISGLGRLDQANYRDVAGKLVTISITLALLLFGFDVYAMLVGAFVGSAFLQVVSIYAIWKIVNEGIFSFRHVSGKGIQTIFISSLNIIFSSLLNIMLNPLNKVIISRYLGTAAVPIYEIAYTSTMQLRGVAETSFRALLPEVASISHMGLERNAKIWKAIVLSLRAFACLAPFVVCLMYYSDYVMQVWLGGRYMADISSAFNIFLVSACASLMGVPAYYALLGMGKTGHILTSHIVIAVSNVVLLAGYLLTFSSVSVSAVACFSVISMLASSLYLISSVREVTRQRV